MDRTLRLGLAASLTLLAFASPASRAALLHPTDTSQFPDLSAGYVSGTLQYSAATGQLVAQDTPYALAMGASPASRFDVVAGQRSQTIDVTLNPDPDGQATVDGTTYSGLLLADTQTNMAGSSRFDFDVAITGGLLAPHFGSEAYVRLTAERWSTFDGGFDRDFSGGKVAGNLRGDFPIPPVPTPEPTALVVLLACGGVGLVSRHRRRIGREELQAAA